MSSGGGQSTTTSQVVRDPQEQQARNTVMQTGQDLYNWSIQNYNQTGYGGAKPADMSEMTREGLGQVWGAARGIEGDNAKAQTANNFGMKDVLYADSNPYLQSHMEAATRPMIQQFMDAGGPLSQIRNNSVANGTAGGSRQGIAEGLATARLGQQVGDMRSTMASEAYTKGLDIQQNAIKNQAMLNMMKLMPGEAMMKGGAVIEQDQQKRLNYNADAWNYQQNAPWQAFNNYANAIYGGTGQAGTSTTSTAPKQDNTGQILGTMGTMAMMAMMSDKRLKSDIVKVGTHKRGFGLYNFTMFGIRQWGVMAQEVLRKAPELVKLMPSGYLSVDYSRI